MIPRLSLLDEAACERLHSASLEVLQSVGVRFASPAALGVLREAGALVDDDSMIVRIPADLVEQAIAAAPRHVLLAGREARHDALLDGSRAHVTLDGIGATTLDYCTGERRSSTRDDLALAVRVADALPEVDVAWYIVNPTDQPAKLEGLQGVATMLRNTGKHVQAEVLHPEEVPYVLDMLAAASAGGRWRRERPHFSAVYCPVAPLQHEKASLEAAMLLAAEGVPMSVFSLALAGATAPVTLAGTVVQTNCDLLSTFVLLQLVAPGCPLIYVGDSAIMDMHSAVYATAGPETFLLNLALTEMGKFYGLPVLTCGFGPDTKEFCVQCGVDETMTALGAFLSGADLVTGVGMLDAAQMLYLPKLILDCEIVRQCRRVVAGVDLDDEHLMLATIARVGPGGHYLGERDTRKFMRRGEHLVPQVFRRGSYEEWLREGVSETARAVAVLDEIVATHRPPALPPGADQALEEILARAARELPER